MVRRWAVVVLVAAALVAVPLLVAARPASGSSVTATALAGRIRASGAVGWSGQVRTAGSLQVPANSSFTTLGQLLGEDTDLRVWWRGTTDWRVDRIRGTGETDLFRRADTTVRWVSESRTATVSPYAPIRLPDASDVLPATLARTMLQGFSPGEVSRLPDRRVAGVDAAGLRLVPAGRGSTLTRVDVWADPVTGLPLRAELYGEGTRPVLTSTVTTLDLTTPLAGVTVFAPPAEVRVDYDQSVDVAAAANAFSPVDLPRELAGLPSRSGEDPGAVGIYGRGATTMLVLPIRGSVAFPLRAQLQRSTATTESAVGTYSPVGPIGVLVTPFARTTDGRGASFLLTGTVDAATLRRAATQLSAAG